MGGFGKFWDQTLWIIRGPIIGYSETAAVVIAVVSNSSSHMLCTVQFSALTFQLMAQAFLGKSKNKEMKASNSPWIQTEDGMIGTSTVTPDPIHIFIVR